MGPLWKTSSGSRDSSLFKSLSPGMGWDHNGGSNFYMEYIIEKNLNKYSILFNNIMPRKAVYSAKAT